MLKWIGLAVLAVSFASIGCSGGNSGGNETPTRKTGQESAPNDAKWQIAVIPKGTQHVFWQAVERGAKKAGDDLGVDVIWKGPVQENDRDEQIKVIEDFVTKGVKGIVLAPLDDTALKQPVENAKAAGIPVLIMDSALKDTDVVSFVATDSKAAGTQAGKHMVKLLNGKGKIIVMRYQENSASTTEREEGFLEAAKAGGLTIISDNQFSGATADEAQKMAETLLQQFAPGGAMQFEGVYCPNESSTFGMLRALENAGLAGKVKFIGFDSSPPLVEGLQGGKIDALMVQNPEKMGYLAVKTLFEKISGKSVESRIDTGAVLVDKENMTQSEIATLLK